MEEREEGREQYRPVMNVVVRTDAERFQVSGMRGDGMSQWKGI